MPPPSATRAAPEETAAAVFAIFAHLAAGVVPSVEIAWVMGFLVLTIFLFAFEVVGVDVAAVT
jgi:predicted membrane metal-binding protein